MTAAAHRADILAALSADLLSAARRAGIDARGIPIDVAVALADWVETAPMDDDPEAEAARAADVRAWRRDRL